MDESDHNNDRNSNHDDVITLVSHRNNDCLCGYTLSDVPPLLTRFEEDDYIDDMLDESEYFNLKYPMRNKIDNDVETHNVGTSVNDTDSKNIVHEMGGNFFVEKSLQLFHDSHHESLCYNDNEKLMRCLKCEQDFSSVDLVDNTLRKKSENGMVNESHQSLVRLPEM